MNLHFRIDHGYDLHRLEPDLPLFIGERTLYRKLKECGLK